MTTFAADDGIFANDGYWNPESPAADNNGGVRDSHVSFLPILKHSPFRLND